MLDIVIVAHKPNYQRMAHRSIDPKGSPSIRGSLPSAINLVPVAGKVILSLEEGKHQDFEAAEAYLATQNLPWQIIHNTEITSYYETLMRGLEHCSQAMVAIIPAWCEITDPLWVQRLTWPMSKDAGSLLCTTGEQEGPAKDLAPFTAKPRKWPGGDIIVARRAELEGILRMVNPDNLYSNLATAIDAASWRLWSHPGIRFQNHPHDNHEARKKTGRQAQQPAPSSHS